MKRNRLIKITFLLSSVIFSNAMYAQDGVAELAQVGPDASKLANAYLSPLFKGLGIGLNSGWANTAHSKNLGRFDIRFGVTGAMVPKKDETFDFNSLGLSSAVRLKSGQSAMSPTISGDEINGSIVEIYNGNNKVREITLPKGTNLPLVPAPQLQATVGLIKGIDVSLRAIPTVKMGDVGSLNMIGGGVKVELLPLIAGKKAGKLLPFDLAVALGYTELSYKKELDYTAPSGSPAVKDNQQIEAKISGFNTQLILSKKLLVFTPFVAIGVNSSKTSGGLKGDYNVITGSVGPVPVYTTKTDPVTLDKKNFSAFRSDIGFQLNLAFLRLYASYSASEYNSFNAGLGFGIGK
ncbi:MAG TPA: DUF6588 family protein [Pedobacter sp.]